MYASYFWRPPIFLKNTFLYVTSFECPKEVTKERAPREKPFSPFTSRFSGMCELTNLRFARTAPILFPKTGCDRGAFQGVYKFTCFNGLYSIYNHCITLQIIVDFRGSPATKTCGAPPFFLKNIFYMLLPLSAQRK